MKKGSAHPGRAVTLEGLRIDGRSADDRIGLVTYRAVDVPVTAGEARADARRRTRLHSAKILDGAHAFVCEATIQDRSSEGLRLLLARNVGLPGRFGVHDDLTGEVVTVVSVWRRGQALGVRILKWAPTPVLKPSQRLALRGRYYAVRD